ncbi:MAG: S41 family peptidase [Bacteroidia bacterium]
MKFRLSILIILLFSFSNSTDLLAQITGRIYSTSQLQSDFRVFRRRYENNLVNCYLYASKKEVDNFFDSLYFNLKPMTEMEFYRYITPVSSLIKDGHSNIYLSKQSSSQFNEQSKYFPFRIYWTGSSLYVTRNLSGNTDIHPGDEIVSINGKNSKDVMNYLLCRQVRDGNNENYALWILNNYFREYYSFHFGHPDSFKLIIKSSDSREKILNVAAISRQEELSLNAGNKNEITTEPSSFFRIDSATNAAIFRIKSWDDKKLKKEIDFVLLQLQQKNLEHLILDLRDNQGGDFSPAVYLLSGLLDQPFQYFTEIKSVSHVNDSSRELKNITGKMLGIHQPMKNSFKGKVYVLINGGCFSNTGAFCSRLEYYKRAVFIGEETGGNKVVFSGVFGLKGQTVLPNTKLLCDNSNYRLTVTDVRENTGYGVMPTYTVLPSIADILQQNDVVLSKTLDLIKSGR